MRRFFLGAVTFGIVAMLCGCSAATGAQSTPTASATPAVQGNVREYDIAVAEVSCMTAKGWDVKADPVGGWGVVAHTPPEQRTQYQDDFAECDKKLGFDQVDLSPEAVGYTYDNNLRVVKCLEDAGYSVEDVPDRDTFISQSIENPKADIWNPYRLVGPNDLGKAIVACPQ